MPYLKITQLFGEFSPPNQFESHVHPQFLDQFQHILPSKSRKKTDAKSGNVGRPPSALPGPPSGGPAVASVGLRREGVAVRAGLQLPKMRRVHLTWKGRCGS